MTVYESNGGAGLYVGTSEAVVLTVPLWDGAWPSGATASLARRPSISTGVWKQSVEQRGRGSVSVEVSSREGRKSVERGDG